MRLIDIFDGFLIDLDGVVYIGNKPTTKAVQTIKEVKKLGKKIVYITNDPRKSPKEYSKRLSDLKIKEVSENIITSSSALSTHLKRYTDLSQKTAFVIGSRSFKNAVRKTGLTLINKNSNSKTDFVIVGGHNKVTYDDLKTATLTIRSGAKFFATNRDPYYPTPEGLVPATGALVAAIETASCKKAIIVGKPEKIMFQIAKSLFNKKDKCAVIGDRLDTDIKGGIRVGLKTILCLTGSTKLDDIENSKIKPDYVIKNLSCLFKDENLSEYH